jgi:hypothetical protein
VTRKAWGRREQGLGRRAARMPRARCGAERCTHRVDFLVLDWQCLTEVFSKILNKSAQTGE